MQINLPRKIRAKKKMTTNNGFHIIIIIYSTQVIIKQSWKSYHLVTSPPFPSETAFLACRAKNKIVIFPEKKKKSEIRLKSEEFSSLIYTGEISPDKSNVHKSVDKGTNG